MRVLAVLVVGVALALPGGAAAQTVISPESGTSYPYARWVERAKVPTPDVTLTVKEGYPSESEARGCAPVVLGCASSDRSWVFVAIASKSTAHETFLHELGHVYGGADETYANIYALCARYGMRLRGQPHPLGFTPTCKALLNPLSSSWRAGTRGH